MGWQTFSFCCFLVFVVFGSAMATELPPISFWAKAICPLLAILPFHFMAAWFAIPFLSAEKSVCTWASRRLPVCHLNEKCLRVEHIRFSTSKRLTLSVLWSWTQCGTKRAHFSFVTVTPTNPQRLTHCSTANTVLMQLLCYCSVFSPFRSRLTVHDRK